MILNPPLPVGTMVKDLFQVIESLKLTEVQKPSINCSVR